MLVSMVLVVLSLSVASSSPNVALGKTVSLSSQYTVGANPGSLAVDNITMCDTPALGDLLAISAPLEGSDTWLMVDLGTPYLVEHVNVYGRCDTYPQQSANLQLRIGSSSVDGGASNPVCGSTFSAPINYVYASASFGACRSGCVRSCDAVCAG